MDESQSAVNEPVVADTTSTESAPVESASSEVTVDEFDGLGDIDLSNSSSVEETPEPTPKAEPAKVADEEPSEEVADIQSQAEKELSPKSENRFQALANKNRELEAQLAELTSREAQVATEQDLINQIDPETDEYYTVADAARLARFQTNEAQQKTLAEERQSLQVQQNQHNLANEAQQSLKDFPMFDEQSKDYNAEIAAQADALLGANLVFDPSTNQIIGSRVSPYQIYKTIADASTAAAARAQVTAQKANERMLANADVTGGAPIKSSGNPLDDTFDRIKDFRFSA